MSDPPKATRDDVVACYRLLLGRAPDADGLRTFEALVGRVDVADLVTFFIGSPEFKAGRHYRTIVARDDAFAVARVDLGTHVMHVLENDPNIGDVIRTRKSYEPHVTRQLSRALGPGSTFADVGASAGFFTLLAAGRVGPTGRVYAFEPSPVNCRLLTMSLVANAFHNVTLFPSAVSDVEELLLYDGIGSNGFVSPLSSAGDATALSSRTVVRSVRLDRVFDDGTRLDALKIDVEGAEFRALSGATAVLGTHRPLVVSEFSPSALRTVSGVDPAAYLRLLVDLGYELGILRPDGAAELVGRDGAAILDAHARAGGDHLDLVAFDPARHRSLVE